jgi:PDZ domain
MRYAALTLVLVCGLHEHSAYAKDPPLLSLSMEHFRDSATLADNSADSSATITTENGYMEHRGLLRMVWSDEFLRSDIDKTTGQQVFHVYAWIIYSGSWRSYETASYVASSGPKSVPANKISQEKENCAVGDCLYTERIAFSVDEGVLREVAAGYVIGKPTIWAYKVTAKAGPDFAGGFSTAEIAGLLAKVDEYAKALPAVKANATSASLRADLGIAGMPVAATAEQPNRAGILVFGVTSGSVAQKSGIIIGDILYEFDGHPMKVLAQFEAAVAACTVNSSATVKLYRGTDQMAVTARF